LETNNDENCPTNEITIGDCIGIKTDFLYRNQQSGHLTVQVCDWCFLSLSLDSSLQAQAKHKHTYLHIATDYKAREQLLLLSKITHYMRRFLETHYDFFDFSTAMLSREHTDDNKLAIEGQSFLRPSIYLKQLIVGGLERVYEIYDNHLYGQRGYPPSQILECCMTLLNLNDMLTLAEKLVSGLAKYLHSTYMLYWTWIDVFSGLSPNNIERKILIDLTPPWSRRFFYQLVEETIGVDFLQLQTIEEAIDVARREGVNIPETQHFDYVAQVAIEVFNQLIAPHLIQPTFVAGYPIEVYPTAKPHRSNPRVAEIAHLFINGFQFATAVSDQTNPYELQTAIQAYTKTDLNVDTHFLTALNYGIPPVGHLVIFLERLNLLMLGITNMQEIIPTLT
jgi:lysyl-tRNA synthetase class 2